MSGFRTWIRSAILLSFLILSAGSDFEEWYVAISMHSKFVRHYISQKRRLQLFAKTDTAGVELSSSNNTQDVSSVVAFSNGKARVLTVEARACMKYMDAELHPSIGSATVQLQRALQERGMADDGITAVAALLHFEKFVGGTGRWAEMLMTMGRAARLPATWDRRHTELLSIANLDMSWFQTQLQVTELQVQLIFEHVVKPNPSQYIMEADSAPNGSQVLEQLRWAVAITRALALPPMFQGDSVAICPVFHAAPHSADAPEVQHTTTELANVLGQTRTIVDKYFIPLPDTTGSPLRIRRVDETGMCAHELFFLFGTREAEAMPCIPLKISVPALSAKPSALAVLRRTAMAAGELVTANSSMSHSTMFNLSPGVPFPTELLRLLRLSNLQYTDAEYFPASDAAGMLISLENELAALRSLRDALLSLKHRYQERLQQLIQSGVIAEQVESLEVPQLRALQHNAKRMEAVNSLLDDCRSRWTAIFTADLTSVGTNM